jgi:hypothetical protein
MSEKNEQQQTPDATDTEQKRKPYAVQNSEKIMDALAKGSAPFLPGPGGFTPEAVRNAETGKVYHGVNQVLLQMHLKENGYKDTLVCTFDQANTARTGIKQGAKSIPLTVYNAETKESRVHHFFPVSETNNPAAFKTPDRTRENQPRVPFIVCDTSDPAKYLGQYLTAVQLGTTFKAPLETQKAFIENMQKDVQAAKNPITRPYEIMNRASVECKENLKSMYKLGYGQTQKPVEAEQKPEKQHRSMHR